MVEESRPIYHKTDRVGSESLNDSVPVEMIMRDLQKHYDVLYNRYNALVKMVNNIIPYKNRQIANLERRIKMLEEQRSKLLIHL